MIGLAPIGLTLEAGEVSAFSVAFAFSYADAAPVVRPTATPAVDPDTRARAEGWAEKITLSAGAATCGSAASAVGYVTRLSGVSVSASAGASVAEVLLASAAGNAAAESAVVGAAHFDAMALGAVDITADAIGAATVEFFANTRAAASASIAGLVFRRMRAPVQPSARAKAELAGLAWSFVWAHGRKALGSAQATGTTYQVGRSQAVAFASAVADGQKVVAGTQPAQALADWVIRGTSALCAYTHARAVAVGAADAAVRIDGALNFECFGSAASVARTASGGVVVFQPTRGWAAAEVGGRGTRVRACSGAAFAASQGAGEGSVVQTATEAKALGTRAAAVGAGVYTHTSRGGCAAAGASAAADALQRPTGVIADAVATAVSIADGVRTRFEAGTATCVAGRVSPAAWRANAAGDASALAAGDVKTVAFVVGVRAVSAESAAVGQCIRIRFIAGQPAQSGAVASGYNQINDLTRAPMDRTVFIGAVDRELTLGSEARLMAA